MAHFRDPEVVKVVDLQCTELGQGSHTQLFETDGGERSKIRLRGSTPREREAVDGSDPQHTACRRRKLQGTGPRRNAGVQCLGRWRKPTGRRRNRGPGDEGKETHPPFRLLLPAEEASLPWSLTGGARLPLNQVPAAPSTNSPRTNCLEAVWKASHGTRPLA